QPFQVTVGIRVGPVVLPGRAWPAAPAGPAGPLAPLSLAPAAAGPVVGFLVPVPARAVPVVRGAATGRPLLARRVLRGRLLRFRAALRLSHGALHLFFGALRVFRGLLRVRPGPRGGVHSPVRILRRPLRVLLG